MHWQVIFYTNLLLCGNISKKWLNCAGWSIMLSAMQSFEYIDKNNAARLLEKMLRGVEKAFSIHIVVHDHKGLLSLPDGSSILPNRNIHLSEACSWQVKASDNRLLCMYHCRDEARRISAGRKSPWRSVCWRGLAEVVVPVYRGETHLATLFAGVFQVPGVELGAFPAEYRELYRSLPVWEDEYLQEIALLLQMIGNGMIQLSERIYEESLDDFGRAGLIRRFLNRHADRNIGIRDLAEYLGLSESRASHLIRAYFDKTFSELLNEERVRRSMTLLAENTASIAEIAAQVGFSNEFYFNRVFRRIAGIPPGAYRKKKSG